MRFWVLFCPLLAGCGFFGSDSTLDARFRPGVAPDLAFSSESYSFIENQSAATGTPTNNGGIIVSCAIKPETLPLPAGLEVDPATCAISGIPTVAAALATYTLQVAYSGGLVDHAVDITVEFSPLSIGNLHLWLSADSLELGNGETIATWRDSSGNEADLTQTTAVNRPTYVASAIGGQPAVAFSQVAAPFTHLKNEDFQVQQPFTVVVVGQASGGQAIQFLFDGLTSRVAAWVNWPTDDGLTLWAGDAGGGAAGFVGPYAQGTGKLAVLQFESGSGTAWVNGGPASSAVPVGSNTLAGLILGTRTDASTIGFTYVSEFLIYGSSLSATQRARLQSHINNQYNLF